MKHRGQPACRIARCALAAVLAIGLMPTFAFAAPATDEAAAVHESVASEASSGVSAAEGQALVLYHASTDEIALLAADGGESADSTALANEGFAVEQEWDFSAIDRAIADNADAIEPLSDEGVEPSDTDLRVALVSREGASTDELVRELEALDFVEAAQPNHVFTTSAAAPNDTYYDAWMYGMHDETAGIDLQAALDARDESSTEANVVAVIDTGVDYTNPDLADNMWRNPGIVGLPGNAGDCGYDFFDNDSDPMPGTSMETSHGTHCAGAIAGVTGNGTGIAGSSSDTEIMALKVAGTDTGAALYENCVVSAFQYAIGAALAGENVVAISNSYHIGGYIPVLDYLVNQAGKAGILSLFAAGNESIDTATSTDYGASIGLASPYAVIVASSNEQNTLSTFSNWNETDVDLAAPGSNILSTVSTDTAGAYFKPQLSHQAGKELAYYTDFSDFAENPEKYNVALQRLDGGEVTEAEREALTVEEVENAAYGEPGLKVTLDTTKLSLPSSSYAVAISWRTDNFFAGSSHAAQDYAYGATYVLDQTVSQSDGMMLAQLQLANADTQGTLATEAAGYSLYDNNVTFSTAIRQIDTECNAIGFGAVLIFGTQSNTGATGTIAGTLTGVGVGVVGGEGVTEETSAYVPYGLMSGTSMATPMLAGACAQLAALNPDASALELRGMIVGSTVAVDTPQGAEKTTATDGRFDWSTALDETSISANTWASETDAATGATIVHGYGLGDATLYFDGKAIEPTAQSDGSIEFTAPASALDGAEHRFDVQDASTGKTHRASYVMPIANEQHALSFVGELPDELADRGAHDLVATDSALYLGALDGSFLYRTDNPRVSSWERVAASGNPWAGTDNGSVRNGLSYGAVGDDLYAFAVTATTDPNTGSSTAHVLVASYDAAQDRWSDFEEIDAIPLSADGAQSAITVMPVATTCGNNVYCALAYVLTTAEGEASYTRLYSGNAADGFKMVGLFDANQAGITYLIQIANVNNSLVALGYKETTPDAADGSDATSETTYEIHGLAFDVETGTWTDLGTFDNAPILTPETFTDAQRIDAIGYGSGVVMAGQAFEGLGDISFIDFDAMEWKGLGTFGVGSSTGLAVSSSALHGDRLYFAATNADSAQTGAAGGLYTLPRTTVEEVLDVECPSADYPDIDHNAWYHEAVDWAVQTGTMTGYEAGDLAGSFGPDRALTRAEMAQLLYNQAGRPTVGETKRYVDVPEDAWCYTAVAWATEQGIFTGYGNADRFGPDDPITREDMSLVLWRCAHAPQGTGDLSRFPDGDTVDSWAVSSMTWAVGEGVFSGYTDTGKLDPRGSTTRAQAATIMMRVSELGLIELA